MNGMEHRFAVGCLTFVVGLSVVAIAYVVAAETGPLELAVAAGFVVLALLAAAWYVRALRR